MCFSYITLVDAIPNHVYLEQGQELSLDQQVPVRFMVCEHRTEAMADIGSNTYEGLAAIRKGADSSSLAIGKHEMMCYLFGVFPIKEVEVSVVESSNLSVSGHVIGIYGKTNGVFVLGSGPVELEDGSYVQPAEHVIFSGDYIIAVNRKAVTSKEELIQEIRRDGENPLVLTVMRGSDTIQVSVQAVRAKNPNGTDFPYMVGLWVKDDMAGIGTMTYFDDQGQFGALGHGISDGETGELLKLSHGYLYEADVFGVKKGQRGNPGELQGIVYYGKKNQVGYVSNYTDIGIYGKLNENYINNIYDENLVYPLAFKQDIHKGEAYLVSDASGERKAYHITIDSLDYSPSDRNKGIRFHVDDENLLELTGGIVQGLSGSPMIQDGKLIGGVTHVLINDPTKGYGIFAETMLSRK